MQRGRPSCGLDDYLDWQQRLANQKSSGLSVAEYCVREGVSTSNFYRWSKQLRHGLPESLKAEQATHGEADSGEALFIPVSLKGSPVEIELPNGAVVRLPLRIGKAVLMDAIRIASEIRPLKARQS